MGNFGTLSIHLCVDSTESFVPMIEVFKLHGDHVLRAHRGAEIH